MPHPHKSSKSTEQHRNESEQISAVRCAVLVISDSRTERTDRSGRTAERMIVDGGHTCVYRDLVQNDPDAIREALTASLAHGAKFVFCTGGTGLGKRDITVDTVGPMLDKVLEGYGEWFRRASWDQIGPAAVLSRAVAGKIGDALVVCSPGSTAAVELALGKLLIPELRHFMREVSR